ncbi:MAG: hypothetical protein M1823_004781 [Watsoniomyces obsoletus]|nr:MAG: hypothetical protein M1823_004781 [Watsoniomyces obsoletus]
MASSWRVLPVSTSLPDPPLLLVRFDFNPNGYTILVTDLVHLWSEILSAEAIGQRARNEACSIDPLESQEQFSILLARIRDSLFGENDTALSLQHTGGGQLVLWTTSPLPAPLPPLGWTFDLSLAPQGQFSREILLPLIGLEVEQAHRMDVLLRYVREKDHVISKLVDKVESSGVRVGDVFLSAHGYAVNRKSLSWDQAGRFVKGLRPFDEVEWKTLAAVDDGSKQARTDVILKALSSPPAVENPALKLLLGSNAEPDWWNSLSTLAALKDVAPATGIRAQHDVGLDQPPQRPEDDEEGDDSDLDDFQRQKTPPPRTGDGRTTQRAAAKPLLSPVRPLKCATEQQADDETTDDEFSTLDIPRKGTVDRPTEPGFQRGSPARSLHTSIGSESQRAEVPSPRKLGAIGGKRSVAPPRSVEERPPTIASDEIPIAVRDKRPAQETVSGHDGPVQESHPGVPSTPHRLGKIGGARRDPAFGKAPSPDGHEKASGVGLRSTPQDGPGDAIRPADHLAERPLQPAPGLDPAAAEARRKAASMFIISEERADEIREDVKRRIAQNKKAAGKKPRKF